MEKRYLEMWMWLFADKLKVKLLTSSYRPRLKNVKLPNYTRSRLRSLTGTGFAFMYNAYISLFSVALFLYPSSCIISFQVCVGQFLTVILIGQFLSAWISSPLHPSPTLLIYPPTSTYILLTKSHLCRRSSYLISFPTVSNLQIMLFMFIYIPLTSPIARTRQLLIRPNFFFWKVDRYLGHMAASLLRYFY